MIDPSLPEYSNETDPGKKKTQHNDTHPESASWNRSRIISSNKSVRINKWVRLKVQRRSLSRMLLHEEQSEVMSDNDGNSRKYCRRVVLGSKN